MKEPMGLLRKSDLNKHEMRKVVMKTAEKYSTREAADILVNIFDSTYVKAELKQVANNATQLNTKERTQLLSILKDFEDLFDGTLGYWYTETVELELNTGSKPFNGKYYPVPRINKETLRLVPYQDVPYALIIWYVSKTIYLS